MERPALARVEQAADVIGRALEDRSVGNRARRRGDGIIQQSLADDWRRRAQRQRIARFANVAAGKGGGQAPSTRPAVEDMLTDLGNLAEQRSPARCDIIGMVVGRLANRRVDEAGECRARDFLGAKPGVAGWLTIE